MSEAPAHVYVRAQRCLRKFRARADVALQGAVWDLGRDAFKMDLKMEVRDGVTRIVGLEIPFVEERELKATIVDCRVFFASEEDCYLPTVMAAIRLFGGPGRAEPLKPLSQHVNSVVKDGKLRGALMYSGRIAADVDPDPMNPSPSLRGDDDIVMDYIYGRLLHEDDERIENLKDVDEQQVQHGALLQIAKLMQTVGMLRSQTDLGVANGWIDLTPAP